MTYLSAQKQTLSWTDCIVAVFFLALSFITRWDVLHRPIADTHTWKQMESYSVIQNYYRAGTDFLHPLRDVMYRPDRIARSGAWSLPAYEYTASVWLRIFGNDVFILRIYSVVLSTFIAWCVYYWGSRHISRAAGLLAALFLYGFPGFIFWGSSIMPEIFATALACVGLVCVVSDRREIQLLGAVLLGIGIATKVTYVAYLFAMIFWILNNRSKYTTSFIIFLIGIICAPYALWTIRVGYIPLVERNWETYSQYAFHGRNIFLNLVETNWFEVLLKDRIMGRLLTPLGGMLLLCSSVFLFRRDKVGRFLYCWLFGCILSFLVVAWGNFEHDYNQILLYPVAALVIAYGCVACTGYVRQKPLLIPVLCSMLLLPLAVWYLGVLPFQKSLEIYFGREVKYAQFQPDIAHVKTIISITSNIILLDLYDNPGAESLLYTLQRPGWIMSTLDSCSPEALLEQTKQFKLLNAQYIIINKEPYYYGNDQAQTKSCSAQELIGEYSTRYGVRFEGSHLAIIRI